MELDEKLTHNRVLKYYRPTANLYLTIIYKDCIKRYLKEKDRINYIFKSRVTDPRQRFVVSELKKEYGQDMKYADEILKNSVYNTDDGNKLKNRGLLPVLNAMTQDYDDNFVITTRDSLMQFARKYLSEPHDMELPRDEAMKALQELYNEYVNEYKLIDDSQGLTAQVANQGQQDSYFKDNSTTENETEESKEIPEVSDDDDTPWWFN